MITTVIFDMDGLLFDTEPIYFECYKKAAAEDGLNFTYELFESCVGISREEAARFILQHFGPQTDMQKLHVRTGEIFEEYLANDGEIRFRPGAKQAVEFFYNRGLKVALASSNITRWVMFLLEKKGIKKYFSSVTTSDDVFRPKPDPEVYLKTAQKLGVDVSECLVFEDSVAGATAAISARMRTCVVPQIKKPTQFVRENAFKIYHSLEDIYPDMDELLA
ncbi:HAD family hydrolase [Candidatus Avelusimicrobium gallicola]|uniref:Haloacid dehalogenase n=1 Tax=Candidatus Avelusimicrobium gallicola TaxID=2562704 RepID=A0A1Y4DIV2_9BACT|nr:HAD family phosphatase [Elusimicrobium sp. An273]OUO56868.1 hypothetical protein B5F75_03205 [Elusimicrobium sp. An273]